MTNMSDPVNPNDAVQQAPGFNFQMLYHVLLEKAWIVLFCFIVAVFLTGAYLKRAPRIYAASVVLQVEQEESRVMKIDKIQGEDLRWPGVALQGARPMPGLGLMRRYMDIVLSSAVEDLQITQEYMGVLGMVNPPLSLARPRMLARVFWSALKRMVKRLSTHENEPSFALSPGALNQLHALPEMHYEQVS